MFPSTKSEVQEQILLAAIAGHPTLGQAVVWLKDVHNLITTETILEKKANYYREDLEQLREQLAPRIEASRANDMLDNAGKATELEMLCMEKLQTQLEQGRVKDPARVARDLADLKAKNIDKRLAVQGRPTQIVETRKVGEIVKALEGLGVAKQVEATVDSTAEDG